MTETYHVTVAAGATNDNILANSIYATIARPSRCRYWAVQDGATAASNALCQVLHGNVMIRPESPVFTFTAGQGPELDKHFIGGGAADVGDRLQVRLRNTGAASSNFRVTVEINSL